MADEGSGLVIWVTPDPEVAGRFEVRLSESTGLVPRGVTVVATIDNVDEVSEQVRRWLTSVLKGRTNDWRGER